MSDPQSPTGPPSLDFLTDWAAYQGIAYDESRIVYAQRSHARLREHLLRLRAIPLSYREPVIEPASSIAWLENGGQS
jgi:hypothetical protein